jgi:diguanylate cyclase (GGDEF)-like protein
MHSQQVSCLVVVDGRQPLGVVSEKDLVQILGDLLEDRCSKTIRAEEFMSVPPVIVQETTTLFDALVLTQSRNIRHLPVVDDKGTLSGILSYANLAYAYEHIIELQRLIIEQESHVEARRLQEANEQLKALSMEDGLLCIGNRRAMEVDLAYTHNAAIRYQRPYSVVLFDVDFFKLYNDCYGHQAGDEALKLIVEHIRHAIRRADRLYRYGGEELLLLLPETATGGAEILANRIVRDLAERNIPHAKSEFHVLTISGGIGVPDLEKEKSADWRSVIERADRSLYRAKNDGRCRVHVEGTINKKALTTERTEKEK